MTLAEAKKEIERKLLFGDEKQIKAIKFLNAAHDALSTIEDCEEHEDHEVGIAYIDLTNPVSLERTVAELEACCCEAFSHEVLVAAIELAQLKTKE